MNILTRSLQWWTLFRCWYIFLTSFRQITHFTRSAFGRFPYDFGLQILRLRSKLGSTSFGGGDSVSHWPCDKPRGCECWTKLKFAISKDGSWSSSSTMPDVRDVKIRFWLKMGSALLSMASAGALEVVGVASLMFVSSSITFWLLVFNLIEIEQRRSCCKLSNFLKFLISNVIF